MFKSKMFVTITIMNDLAYVLRQSKLSAYADDTQIFHADTNYAYVPIALNFKRQLTMIRAVSINGTQSMG